MTWDEAVRAYSESTVPAAAIARALGIPLTSLYQRANRAGLKKRRPHRLLKAGTSVDKYRADLVNAAVLSDLSARDAELLVGKPRFRCGECLGISTGPVCVCGAVINPFITQSA